MTELQQVEQELQTMKHNISVGEMLERLSSNKDFKTLILDGYLRENAIRLVHLKSHPNQQTPDKQAALMRQMDGIGALEDHFRSIRQQAELAKDSLDSREQFKAELIREGSN